jgi:hypothetical protein
MYLSSFVSSSFFLSFFLSLSLGKEKKKVQIPLVGFGVRISRCIASSAGWLLDYCPFLLAFFALAFAVDIVGFFL